LSESKGIAVTGDHQVFATTQGPEGTEIVRFGPGDLLPELTTPEPLLDEIGHTNATVRGQVRLAGGTDVVMCEVEYGVTTSYSSGTVPCIPDPAESPPGSHFASATDVSAELAGLTTAATYHYRINAENEDGENFGIDRTVTPSHVLKVRTMAATGIDTDGATLNASFDPDGLETTYRFLYGPTTSYGFETPEEVGGSGMGSISVGSEVSALPSGRTFHYRVIATNANGSTTGPDLTFRTASPPEVEGVQASEIEPSSARLNATINPVGYATEYHFEYGTTPEYGQEAPTVPVDIGSGTAPVEVHQKVEGLQPGVTYHYRVVAENQWGVSIGDNTTFDYAPPACPNDHVRQLTLSSYLPDCRAYELVSPAEAGGILLFPSVLAMNAAVGPGFNGAYGENQEFNVNTGFATSPARFMFFGGLGTIDGLDGPVGRRDSYLATRSNQGWRTTLPGLTGNETSGEAGRQECSESLHMCIDHREILGSIPIQWGFEREWSPFIFTAAGEKRGRLPTNVGVIPGGTQFRGAQKLSGDFNHYVFSSNEYRASGSSTTYPALAFAPGGVTDPFGSAYDDDIGARTVTLISKLPNGEDIPQEAPKALSGRSFDFPGLSADGSHILMSTPAGGGLLHLFMRVNQAITYDVSRGAGVEFVGMTRSGSKAMFQTSAQLTVDDTDSSIDLYLWSEGGPEPDSVTRISHGNGQGNSDECAAAWTTGCNAVAISPERWLHDEESGYLSPAGQDDRISEVSGDVYFYSPEVLDPSRLGLRNERNLYVYHDGSVQLVGPLEAAAGTEVKRMQISPDGGHAAILTASQLTPYENAGFDQVYSYDADARVIRCASCRPDGQPPTEDVYVSQGGRFMADDGRTFFATADDLVPRDQNGGKIDVYEYVGGRPQLITTGLASRDNTGGSGISSPIGVPSADIGLEHVSHDGVDVYFSTFETIIPEDRNGEFIKFYDARTGGGFLRDPELGPCVAADECHGPDSSRPASAEINTATELGRGNVIQGGGGRRCGAGKVRRGRRCVSARALARRACRGQAGSTRRRCVRKRSTKLRRIERRRIRSARMHRHGGRIK
jgi:hypothetical protein